MTLKEKYLTIKNANAVTLITLKATKEISIQDRRMIERS